MTQRAGEILAGSSNTKILCRFAASDVGNGKGSWSGGGIAQNDAVTVVVEAGLDTDVGGVDRSDHIADCFCESGGEVDGLLNASLVRNRKGTQANTAALVETLELRRIADVLCPERVAIDRILGRIHDQF